MNSKTRAELHGAIFEIAEHLFGSTQLANLNSEARAVFDATVADLEVQLSETLDRDVREFTASHWAARITSEDQQARQLAGRLLPRGSCESCFGPYYQDLLSQFVEDMSRCNTAKEKDRRCREFAWEVRRAIVLTWWALARDAMARSIRWVAVALLGDGAVRVVYWAFTEILRRL